MKIIKTVQLYQAELKVIISLINKRAKLHNVEISNLTYMKEPDELNFTASGTKSNLEIFEVGL